MNYSKLISASNLELAWRRIVTGRNMQYKRFFRPIYLAYELAYKENIAYLQQKLRGGWKPTPPSKIYLPKASGLQRPLSLLRLDDQIVLQAVANAFADKLHSRRQAVEGEVVFSNLLEPNKNSAFFIQDWHTTYQEFQNKCSQHYNLGYKWIAQFDLSAFYDTISHDLLIRMVSPRGGNSQTWNRVKSWFNSWCSSAKSPLLFQHGIPQGPIASDFLAECLLLPLDEALLSLGIRYVRYVDDIRIFADSRLAAQKAALDLEVSCRNLGLIPQGKKFSIFEAESESQTLGMLPSLAPPDSTVGAPPAQVLSEADALRKFKKSISGRPYKIFDKSLARYVMYRAPKSRRLLDLLIRLLPRHPEHIDAFSAYFSNFRSSLPLERSICDLLLSGIPYQYMRAELWLIMARIGSMDMCERMIPSARQDLKDDDSSVHLRWGALAFLLTCQKYGLGKYSYRVSHQPSIVQALIAPIIPDTEYVEGRVVNNLLLSKDYLPGIVLAEQLIRREQTHRDYGIRVRELAPQVQNTFRSLGIIRRRSNIQVDQIANVLNDRYNITPTAKWRTVLGGEYTHALQILLQADALYDAGRSNWLSLQNSFNDAVTRSFILFLNANNLPGGRSLAGKDGRMIKYGVLLDPNAAFSVTHSDIAGPFREANNRRNKLPGSHPYDEKGGNQNKYLSSPEQNILRARLQLAYERMIDFVDQHS